MPSFSSLSQTWSSMKFCRGSCGVTLGVDRAGMRNRRVPGGDLVHVADHQASIRPASAPAFTRPLARSTATTPGFARLKIAQPRHVAHRAVGIMGQHPQLLAPPDGPARVRAARALIRSSDGAPAGLRGMPVGDPAAHRFILRATRLQPLRRRRAAAASEALRSSRLLSGAAGKTRRPWASLVIGLKSNSGSKPKSDS